MKSYKVEEVLAGDFNPSLCLKHDDPSFSVSPDFDYPIESFINGTGSWDMNGSRNIDITDIELFKEFIHSDYDELYYVQDGFPDGDNWYILAKTQGYYIHFDAGCDFTGFDCQGGGTFAYSKDWKTLWNMHTTNTFRMAVIKKLGFNMLLH